MFALEPLTGKIVTPVFGGTAAIWSTCLFFFQFAVLCGYALTFFLARLSFRRYLIVYSILVLCSALWMRLPHPEQWQSSPGGDPVWQLLYLLILHVGVPSVLLSSISGTMQVWYRNLNLGNPYPLYSVSNVGSLAALVAYPLLMEPNLTVRETLWWWGNFYLLLIICVLGGAWIAKRVRSNGEGAGANPVSSTIASAAGMERTADSLLDFSVDTSPAAPGSNDKPEVTSICSGVQGDAMYVAPTEPPTNAQSDAKKQAVDIFCWILLSMLGSLVLLTQTAHITSDIAPVPLLWIAPLAIYLITFILVFASPIFYIPMVYTYAWPILAVAEILTGRTMLSFKLGLNLLNIFLLCMICHGELAAAKPPASRLPLFWLCTSIGGVLAGLLVSVVAPLVFSFDLERHLTYLLMVIVTLVIIAKRKIFVFGYRPATYSWMGWSSAVLVVLLIGDIFAVDVIHRERNFYGSVQVRENSINRLLVSGQILHGEQFVKPEYQMIPTSYFQLPLAFIDTFLRCRSRGAPRKYAVVGLGVGTIAAYGRKGDIFDYFEIDPKVVRIARKYFTYVSGSPAKVNILMGDARSTIKSLSPETQYDLLVVDAFNGDAIPVHLLTTQAMTIYLSHLKPEGILLFHVSNRFIKLVPPVSSSARSLGLNPLELDDIRSLYLALVRKPEEIAAMKECVSQNPQLLRDLKVSDVPVSAAKGWTDDFANLASYLNFK